MTLNEMIFKRKSCRSFTGTPVDGANPETFRFFQAENMAEVPGYVYIGSLTI